jgi:hypothetical protein
MVIRRGQRATATLEQGSFNLNRPGFASRPNGGGPNHRLGHQTSLSLNLQGISSKSLAHRLGRPDWAL